MHEMSYVVRFVNRAIETAQEKDAKKVNKIVVAVGEMTDVLPEYLYRYYPAAVKNTILDGSELVIIPKPAEVICESCSNRYHPEKDNGYACPNCKSSKGKVVSGREVILEQIELEY